MPTIDELLNASNEVATCTVNPDTREIIVPEKYKILGVFSDEKVTKILFTFPKVVGNNVDLTEYNLYINYQNAIGRHNAYLVDDVAVSGDNITFSWLLSRDVTLSSGVVKYSVCAKKLNGDSISNEWNTAIANGVVIQGLEATQAIVEENSDIIEAILSKAHTHANKSVLDKFAESNGKPTYDGKYLGGSDASVTEANITSALGYKPVAPGDIPVVPTADISANTSARHSHTNKDVLDSITAADKTKLNSVENGATKTIVDTAMSDTSTNPVQNKVIKKYIDDHVSADVYVDFWPTGSEQYNGNYNGYQIELATDQTFDSIFDSFNAGNKIVARLYKDADKSELSASSVDAAVTGSKEFGAIHFQFITANADTDAVAGFPFIGEGIIMMKLEEAALIYLIENRNVLPTPNADGTDNGKVPIINGTKWELKTLPTYANGNEVSY